jgi:anti-sigma-K factor RskA
VTEELETSEILAGEYVLGLLRGEDRLRFEARLAEEATLRAEVEAWERRLAPLAESLPEIAPAPRVWRRLSARTLRRAPRDAGRRTLRIWRALALASGAAALVLAALLVARRPEAPPLQIALLADEQAHPVLLVSATPERGPVQVRLLRQPETPKDRTLELWLLPEAGGAPRSLGLLSSEGPTQLRLTPEQLRAFGQASGLAVSVEPPGGSPTGAPTGPVVFSGALQTPL